MDSINKQQPEENRKDLFSAEAVEKIRELIDKSKSCFFCTRLSEPGTLTTRPMAVQKVEENGVLLFLSASDSHKNLEIAADPQVQLFFQGSAHSDFMTLTGKATISTDRQKIEELWEPLLKTWFTGGKDDPRITVIEFTPEDGYYWDTKNGNFIAFAKQLIGAAMGTTLDDSIEGKIMPGR